MALPGTPGQYGIPPAFLRDDDLPPPPPSDPHWREWPHHDGGSPRSRQLLSYAAPLGALLMLVALILAVKLFVLPAMLG